MDRRQGGDRAATQLPAGAATPTVNGSVGPGVTISLKQGGKAVKTLKPGSYTITVKDQSTSHDFHLFGPGVKNVITTVPFKGTKKVTVTLKAGKYNFYCSVPGHEDAGMHGTLIVS